MITDSLCIITGGRSDGQTLPPDLNPVSNIHGARAKKNSDGTQSALQPLLPIEV